MESLRSGAALCALLALAACTSLQPRPGLPQDAALPAGSVTRIDELIAPAETAHPGQSAFRLVREGPEAFAIRSRSAALAGRSIDVQTYIWHADLTGAYLGLQLLQAADRGVKVRLLVDDMDARSNNYAFAALDAHPNIEVRMFNPFASRKGKTGFALEALGSARRINRRMHNKSWIVDNRIAVVGGRNLGDEYFGASDEVNFVDLDFAMIGPIVREASTSFDRYWNSPAAYPMSVLAPQDVTTVALESLRGRTEAFEREVQASRFAAELRGNEVVRRLLAGDWPMHWASNFRFVADDPAKVHGQDGGLGGSYVLETLVPMLRSARSQVSVISPYFVPGPQGTEFLVGIDRAGPAVRVLTNSLAANDVALVYGGYATARKDLLRGGVELWELKPTRGAGSKSSLFGSSGASLHTKALAVDDRLAFVGSYNLDPRSTSLNCEQGIFVESSVIASQLAQIFRDDSAGERAWSVTLVDGSLSWHDGDRTWTKSPEASFGRKFQAWIARVLPVSSQL